jgi:hypothetical protein
LRPCRRPGPAHGRRRVAILSLLPDVDNHTARDDPQSRAYRAGEPISALDYAPDGCLAGGVLVWKSPDFCRLVQHNACQISEIDEGLEFLIRRGLLGLKNVAQTFLLLFNQTDG